MTGADEFPYPTATPEAVDASKHVLLRVHELLADSRADVDDGKLGLESSWGGYAAATCVADVKAMTGLLSQDHGLAEDGMTALQTYRTRVDGTRTSIDGLRKKYDAAALTRMQADQKVPSGIPDEDKEPIQKANEEDFNSAVGGLYIEYHYIMQGHDGDSALAANALQQAVETLSPPAYRQSPTGGAPDIDVGSYTSAGMTMSLVMTLDASPDADRRSNEFNAWMMQMGYPPSGPSQWKVAAMLDPTSYNPKNKGVPATIQLGMVTPQPGKGLVRIGWYIPAAEVANVPHFDLGDNRGMNLNFDPESTRIAVYIDYETGMVICRQNPSVSTDGDVKVGSPEIKLQQKMGGQIRITYDASNALAPPGGNATGHTVNGDIVVTPGYAGSPTSAGYPTTIDGTIGDYPSVEAYQDHDYGPPTVVTQYAATTSATGPALRLTQHHEVGTGSSAVDPFYNDPDHHHIGPRNPYLKYPDRYPDTTLGDPDNPPTVVTVP